jgi:hypothetical protein
MGGIAVGGEYGRVEGGEPRRQDDGAHVDLMDLRLHFMADRFGQAGRDALVALRADAAGQATPDFLLYGRFVKTQLDFVETRFSSVSGSAMGMVWRARGTAVERSTSSTGSSALRPGRSSDLRP